MKNALIDLVIYLRAQLRETTDAPEQIADDLGEGLRMAIELESQGATIDHENDRAEVLARLMLDLCE
jgi:4-aminobutyrate aminotransferase-like enzyme